MKSKIKPHHLGLCVLLLLSVGLRFVNLSYSEFQDDEKKTQIRSLPNETSINYLLRQRKGPMQFLAAYIPFKLFNPRVEVNELAVRLPFTVANLISVFVLYAFIHKVTKSHGAALFTSSIYSVNGFVIGFSRIAQYQSLNLLFSMLSLFFFYNLVRGKNHLRRSAFLGTLFIALSLLSHWDAVFYVVPIIYFVITMLLRKDINARERLIIFILMAITFSLLILPFMTPYITGLQSTQSGNMGYLFRRIGTEGSLLSRHLYIFELYNPVITLWLYALGSLLAIIYIKKCWMFIVWFFVNLALIKFFMITPKTHIYNYVVPIIILSCLGYFYAWKSLRQKVWIFCSIFTVTAVGVVALLVLQSYQIFVDHEKEYPYDEKTILWHQNKVFIDEETITFGFPHNRNWKIIDRYINPNCRYITNEAKSISQIYVKALFGKEAGCYYIVYIKKPFYTPAQDAVFANTSSSKLIYKYERNGETLSKVYKMR